MKFIYNILFLSLGSALFAQPNDSIFIKKNENVALSKTILWENPIQATSLNFANYTQSGVQYLHENLNIKRTQTADDINQYQFFTEGFYKYNNKLNVFGDFKINQITEDGLAYNLSNERTADHNKVLNPNYYYSPSKGNWKNQQYQISAGGSYEFLKNTFFGLSFKYENALNNRISDPRPTNTSNLFDTKISLGYRLKNNTLAFSYQNISAKLENETYYENRANVNPSTDPQYYIKFASGYGYKVFIGDFSKYLNKTNGNFFGISYGLKVPNTYMFVSFEYGVSQTNHFPINNNSGENTRPLEFDYLARYKSQNTSTKSTFYLNKELQNNSLEIKATFKTEEVMNFVATNKSTNYLLLNNALNLESIYNINNNKYLTAIGFDAYFDILNVKDLLGITEKDHSSLDFSIFAQNRFNLNKNNSIFVHFALGAYTPIRNNLTYVAATQDQDFANNVIKNDDVYDGTKKWHTQLLTHYDVPFNKNKIRFTASYKHLNAFKTNLKNTNYILNGSANYYGIGISVIY